MTQDVLEIKEKKDELLKMILAYRVGKNKNTAAIARCRREIAQLATKLQEKELHETT